MDITLMKSTFLPSVDQADDIAFCCAFCELLYLMFQSILFKFLPHAQPNILKNPYKRRSQIGKKNNVAIMATKFVS